MGFLDKAKAMAEQAQQKLDEVQKDFNAKQSGGAAGAGAADAPAVHYDSAGRPIAADAPAERPVEPAATGAAPEASSEPPPAPAPAAGFEPSPVAPAGDPLAEATPPPPAAPAAPAAPPSEDSTPGLTSGDPLAG